MSWKGRKVVITSGPTREYLDPVRYLTNASSGRMGFALARAARRRGADVVVISGPAAVPAPRGVRVVAVVTAEQMRRQTLAHFADADIVIAAAAVGDWRPVKTATRKLKKDGRPLRLTLVPTVDILAELGRRRGKRRRPVLVGFALETHDWIARAREKMRRKGVDFIVANKHTALASATTRIAVLGGGGERRCPPLSKERAAAAILRRIEGALSDA
ncbi:MAG: phosphopantothenoylcysteine decarboxylase [Elusimicrobiota bacterium]